jgi:hypothetical protein
MERLRADGTQPQPHTTQPKQKEHGRPTISGLSNDRPDRPSMPKPSLICLPGEVLQVQLEG